MKENSISKFKKNENELNDKSSNEEESNIIIPDDEYIESFRIPKENIDIFEKNEQNDGIKNNQDELFVIEINNKISNEVQDNNLTISKNIENKIENNLSNKNDINKEKRENENICQPYEEYEEEGEENLIIDYDDETNSHQPENKSFDSHKNKISLDQGNKLDIKIDLVKNNNNIKENSINIENNKEKEEKIIYNKINSYKSSNIKKDLSNKYKKFNNKSQKIEKKLDFDIIENDIIDKVGKTFSEFEEENRINYLLSSKNNFNEKDAQNLLDLKKVINDAIKKTKNNIQKINNYENNIIKSNKRNNNNNINHKIEKLKIEEVEHITLDYSSFNKSKNNINKPINVENINLIGNKDNKDNKDNKFVIQKIIIDPFNNNYKMEITSSNKKNEINNIEKFGIFYNKEFSFAPPESSSHNKEKEIVVKSKNIIINNNYVDIVNKNGNKEFEEMSKELNEISNSQGNIINKKYFINNQIKKEAKNINNNVININSFQNCDRLINEEMIRNFLNNHKNERILQMYNTTPISNPNNNQDKSLKKNNKDNYYYKNKYLGYTLEGSNRNKDTKNVSYPNSNKNKINNIIFNDNKEINEDLNKIKINQNKENDNNISGLNNLCNMLNDLFYEDKIKKNLKNIDAEYKNKKNDNTKISLHKNIKTEQNDIKQKLTHLNNNRNKGKEMSRTNSNTLDFSNININNDINYYDEEILQNFNEQSIFNTKNNISQNKKSLDNEILKTSNYKSKSIHYQNRKYTSNNKGVLGYLGFGKKIISQQNNKNKINFPLAKMNFNQRLKHFTNKKVFDLKKIKNDIINIEEDIYTFYPITNKNIQRINYENRKNITKINRNIDNNRKTKINYKRINELYMDYKERDLKIKKIAKENDIKNGISFNPYFCSNKYWKNKSKNKVNKITYLKLDNI